MKKLAIAVGVCLLLLAGGGWLLGLSPTNLKANVDVGLGISAKLACSGHYLTGLSDARIAADLASYSAALNVFDLHRDAARQQVSASLLGLAQVSASYRPGLGCTLDIGDTGPLDELAAPTPAAPDTAPWPLGNTVTTIDQRLQSQLLQILAADNDNQQETRALLVAHRGSIVAEAYAPGFTASTPHLGWSMGKSLVAIMLGYLQHHGEVDVDETGLFAEWQDDRAAISLQNMLHMTSGLDFNEVYLPGSDATRMLFASHDAAAVAKASPLAHPPGSFFSYSSGTTNMLANLFVTRSGGVQPAVNRLYNDILAPLGARHTTLELDPSGTFVGSSYVYASARDWARLGQLMLNEGTLNGVQLLSPAWVHASQQPNHSTNHRAYGYQFWLNQGDASLRWPQLPADTYAMQGNRAQLVMLVPSRQLLFVRLGWSAGRYPSATHLQQILQTVDE